MKSLLLRYGAYGDLIYILPLVDRLVADGKEVYLHTGLRGLDIFRGDPRFKSILISNPGTAEDLQAIIEKDIESVNPDEFINLTDTMEGTLIPGSEIDSFFWTVETRRKFSKGEDFYSLALKVAGYPAPRAFGECGTVAYANFELDWADRWRKIHEDHFIVMMPVTGSNAQKRFSIAKDLGKKILDRYPDAVLYLMGGRGDKDRAFSFGNGRVYPAFEISFRQALLMARYVDYVVGPETGLVVGAGMWGTPKTMLCTASSVFMATNGQRNDYSRQAALACSPCLRAIYKPEDCYHPQVVPDVNLCNFYFDQGEILDSIDLVYRQMRYRRDLDANLRTAPIRVSELLPDLGGLPDHAEPLRSGVHG